MDNTSITQRILRELLIQAPVLFAGALGLVVAIRFWRKAPAASLWCATAFVLALSGSALTIYSWLAGNNFVNSVVVLVLRAATYILFLIGVYAGRTNASAGRANSRETLWQPIVELFRARPWLKGLFRTAFVSTFLLGFVGSVIFTFLKVEIFVGTARVRLGSDLTATTGTNSSGGLVGTSAPYFIQTESEIMRSQVVLEKVAKKLDLTTKWQAKSPKYEPLTVAEAVGVLKSPSTISLNPIRNTSLIEINAYSEKPEEAMELANAVAESYREYRMNTVVEIIDRQIAPNTWPVKPNKSVDIFLGLYGSLWMAIVVGALVVWISIKFDNKQIALAGPKAGEKFGQEWVTAQNSLGAALRDQARRTDGVEALRLLDEAATAYRAVLDAGTRDRFPQGWAMAQNNLGVLLRDRAEWSQPDAAVGTLKEAVTAHRAALEVYTREQYPHYWATTQNNLGVALRDQAKRSQGTEATRLLNEAVAACRAAVEN